LDSRSWDIWITKITEVHDKARNVDRPSEEGKSSQSTPGGEHKYASRIAKPVTSQIETQKKAAE